MSDAPSSDLVVRLRDSAAKVMPGIPRDQLLEAATEIERLRLVINPTPEPEPTLPDTVLREVHQLLVFHQTVNAVILVRKHTGCRLKTAMDYVKKMQGAVHV
jgi:hypothetical protein